MTKIISTNLIRLALLSSTIALALGINYISAATTWKGPTALPPGANVDAPINVGTTNQVKDGNFSAGSATNDVAGVNPVGFSVIGSQYINGWLKVGDNAVGIASQPLELVGAPGVNGIKFPDGSIQTGAAVPANYKAVLFTCSSATPSALATCAACPVSTVLDSYSDGVSVATGYGCLRRDGNNNCTSTGNIYSTLYSGLCK